MRFVLLVFAGFVLGMALLAARNRRMVGAWWVPAMAAAELAPWFLVGTTAIALGALAAGWVTGVPGPLALGALSIAALLFASVIVRSLRTRPVIEQGLADFLGRAVVLPGVGVRRLFAPFPRLEGPFAVATHSYGSHQRHRVDRIARHDVTEGPVFVHIHGGGWWRGRRGRQARPLIRLMASRGWVVLAPSYRLSPEATFPDHLDDIELLIGWIRTNAGELGVDPSFIAVAGGSAGGQLAALAGMGEQRPDFVVPLYGVHDLLAQDAVSPRWSYLETVVLKSRPSDDPAAWKAASPARRPSADRCPFLVIHGGSDWVVPASESRDLVRGLRSVGGPAVGHIEIPGANHGFDFFASIRSLLVAEGIALAAEETRVGSRESSVEDE